MQAQRGGRAVAIPNLNFCSTWGGGGVVDVKLRPLYPRDAPLPIDQSPEPVWTGVKEWKISFPPGIQIPNHPARNEMLGWLWYTVLSWFKCNSIYKHLFTHTHTHTHTQTHTHTHIYIYTYTNIHVHIYIYIYIYTHTNTHTHTNTRS
jgi:hypothetical protein